MAIVSLPRRGVRTRRRVEKIEAAYDPREERIFDLLVLVAVVEFLIIAVGIGVLALQAAGLAWPR